VSIKFILPDGQVKLVNAKLGSTLLDVVLDNNVAIDGFGACEGTLACSTCHLVFSEQDFNKLPTKASDEELDMLDLAYGLTETSRLGCQIKVTEDMNNMQVTVPAGMADARFR
ncbi:hypothetical protein HELRODRAFT_84610, partial [Helobdella robusta]|uniref:2Fe-2S ferredoxin-type domain-containing protein n=1 Tax=Helobdella robusta TaxID=6412 RepID=T1G5K8_HELRO